MTVSKGILRLGLRFVFPRYHKLDSPTELYPRAKLAPLELRQKNERLKMWYAILGDIVLMDGRKIVLHNTSRIS